MRDMGMVLMPHQCHILDVALEVWPDGSPCYREVIVLMPRQNAKTTTTMAVWLHRVLVWERQPQRVAYSAQSGKAGRDKLLSDQAPLLLASPLADRLKKIYSSMGSEAIVVDTGGRVSVIASREAAGHGQTLDLAILDELWADTMGDREKALKPAQITRADAQLWVVSTAGTEASAALKRKVDLGRAAVLDEQDRGVAYFEWSADADADITDPAVWRGCMPALGYTITEEAIRHALATSEEDDFRRMYLNIWTAAEERIIPEALWRPVCVDGLEVERGGRVVFGVDAMPDRSSAAIVAVDSQLRCELVEHREGVGWLPDRVAELTRDYSSLVAVDTRGPLANMLPDMMFGHVGLRGFTSQDMSAAAASLYDGIADRRLRVRSSGALDAAVAGARKRIFGDQWYWSRATAATDLAPLLALTLGYALALAEQRAPEPFAIWA
jgi:phage terminase large subunit-like protein